MERSFKGIFIPKEIWEDTRLTILEKGIFAEIDSLDGEDHCYASNEYLAEFCGCTERSVSNAISKLIELGYIRKIGFNGRTRILASNLHYTVAYVLSAEHETEEEQESALEDQGRLEKSSTLSMQTRKIFYADTKKLPVSINNIYKYNNNEKIEEKIKEKNKQTESKTHSDKTKYQQEFDSFWEAYPRHIAKHNAERAFAKASQTVSLQTMLDAIEKQKQYKAWREEQGKFASEWPHPATWLNGCRWEDDVEIPEKQSATKKEYEHDTHPWRLSNWMSRKIHSMHPSIAEVPEEVLQKWASVFDEMIVDDKHDHEEILSLMRYTYKNDFWKSKITSPYDLRKHYVKILSQAESEGELKN